MPEMTDEERFDFLVDLDDADVDVTAWEADFLGSVLERNQRIFSEKQRHAIDKMYARYTGQGRF